jgi:hypothetical protein
LRYAAGLKAYDKSIGAIADVMDKWDAIRYCAGDRRTACEMQKPYAHDIGDFIEKTLLRLGNS